MKRLIIALVLLVSTSANASVYLCQSSSINGNEARHQISSVYIEQSGVKIQSKGEIKPITGEHYSLEKADDQFILKRLNHNLLVTGSVTYTQVLGDCRLI